MVAGLHVLEDALDELHVVEVRFINLASGEGVDEGESRNHDVRERLVARGAGEQGVLEVATQVRFDLEGIAVHRADRDLAADEGVVERLDDRDESLEIPEIPLAFDKFEAVESAFRNGPPLACVLRVHLQPMMELRAFRDHLLELAEDPTCSSFRPEILVEGLLVSPWTGFRKGVSGQPSFLSSTSDRVSVAPLDRFRELGLEAGVVFKVIHQFGTLFVNAVPPTVAVMPRLVLPLEQVDEENFQAAHQLALEIFPHVLNFFGDVRDVSVQQLARPQQGRLLVGPAVEIRFVLRSVHRFFRSRAKLSAFASVQHKADVIIERKPDSCNPHPDAIETVQHHVDEQAQRGQARDRKGEQQQVQPDGRVGVEGMEVDAATEGIVEGVGKQVIEVHRHRGHQDQEDGTPAVPEQPERTGQRHREMEAHVDRATIHLTLRKRSCRAGGARRSVRQGNRQARRVRAP